MNIAIMGIGQPIRGDDGAGPAAVEQWSRSFPQTASDPEIHILYSETPGFDLLEVLQDAGAILIVDAVMTGSPAGSIHIVPSFPGPETLTIEKRSHGFGIAEVTAVLKNAGFALPERFALLGIEIGNVEFGAGLSDPVQAAMPAAVQEIQNIVSGWQANN
jgi:hydrogenase maturation protease